MKTHKTTRATPRAARTDRPPWRRPLAAALLLAVVGGSGADDDGTDADRARALVKSGAILPLSHFLQLVQQHKPGRIIEVELENEPYHGGYVYEFQILSDDGKVWELEFLAETGELVEKELEYD